MVESAALKVELSAAVTQDAAESCIIVTDFQIPGHKTKNLLPDIKIGRKNGCRVHTDTGQDSNLSHAVGQAIVEQIPNFEIRAFDGDAGDNFTDQTVSLKKD